MMSERVFIYHLHRISAIIFTVFETRYREQVSLVTFGLVAAGWLVRVVPEEYIRRSQIAVDHVSRMQSGYKRTQSASYELY